VIRHRPGGRGHAYRVEPDQRVPVDPVEGEPVELRATTPASVAWVAVELEVEGRTSRVQAAPFVMAAEQREPGSADDGHLALAAAGAPTKGRRSWRAILPALPSGTAVRYRFVAADGTATRESTFIVAGWSSAGGRLVGIGPAWSRVLVRDSVEWLVAGDAVLRVRFALRLDVSAHVMGFGERFNRLDQRGQRLDAVVFEQYKRQGQRTYLPMPYAIVTPTEGSSGWGFHVRTSRRSWYDVGATDPGRLIVEALVDRRAAAPVLEVAAYEGDPAEVLAAFLADTGAPVLPPPWIFRPWISGNEWNTQARVVAEVERSLRENIPVGVVVIEAWSDETTFAAFRDAESTLHADGSPHRLADFRFPADGAWPDPRGMADWLHEHDIRLVLWQIPLLRAGTHDAQLAADRRVMVERGYGIREADGRPYRNRGWWFPGALMPDWTNAEATRWWIEKRRYLVEDVGVDGFKTDGGEHAWGDELRYADGTRGDVANNEYPVRYAAVYRELLASAGREPMSFSRAGFTGAAGVPCHWAGDEGSTWEAFRASVTAGLTAAVSGVFFWGWDIAGFSGEIPDAELYLRATAMGALCPIMQYHSEYNHHRRPSRDRTPWNIAERTDEPAVLEGARRFAHLRERLRGYLEAQAARSVELHRPLMRPLAFDWPADDAVWHHPFQYLLGDDLLVAPVVEPGVASWAVYLPAGAWVDAWTGVRHAGPVVVERAVPLDEIPVYVRPGAWTRLRSAFSPDTSGTRP
jgi:alpha-glucosidase (family GH31 glycosyl hydrolase)